MARGIPSSTSEDRPVAIKARRLKNIPLARVGIFQSEQEKKDDKTGEIRRYTQIKLSLDWDTGHKQLNAKGEEILDDYGDPKPHYINEGFVTLSGDKRANLIEILKALMPEEHEDGTLLDEDGNLSEEAGESAEMVFGENGLGDDYAGAEFDELPFYDRKGNHRKREVEVPVLSWKILGQELIGRRIDATIAIKNEYNRIEQHIPAEAGPLGDGGEPRAKPSKAKTGGMSKSKTRKGKSREEAEVDATLAGGPPDDPENDATPWEPEPTTKQAVYVTKKLKEAGVPPILRVAVAQAVAGNPEIDSIAGISVADANAFKEMVKADPDIIAKAVADIEDQLNESVQDAELNVDDDADFDDDEFDENDEF